MAPDILCIGSVLWDIIGRSPTPMASGADVPGRIAMVPGGVALNIAMTLRRLGMRPALLSAIGRDAEGDALVAACDAAGLITRHLLRGDGPTDRYMAIEGSNGLIAAIADAHSLEAVGDAILAPLRDGALASPDRPWAGPVALDGNLTAGLLAQVATSPLFAAADLRVAPASPGKADRLTALLTRPGATLYLNLDEACILAQRPCLSAADAARALLDQGAVRVLVTDGARPCADGMRDRGVIAAEPPAVTVARVTGAGDTFMAAHIVAERAGAEREAALARALRAAADHVTGEAAS